MLLLLALKWCLTLCDRMDSSPPGSSIHGHFQARILDWVWFPSPGNLLGPGIKLVTPALTGGFSSTEPPGKPREDTIAAAQFPCCVWLSVATWTVTIGLLCPWGLPGKNTGMGYHFLLWRISLNQGSSLHLLHWQANFLTLSQQECPEGHVWKAFLILILYFPTFLKKSWNVEHLLSCLCICLLNKLKVTYTLE